MSPGQLAASTQPHFPSALLGDTLYPTNSVSSGTGDVLRPAGGQPRGLGVWGRCLLAVLPREWSPARDAGRRASFTWWGKG